MNQEAIEAVKNGLAEISSAFSQEINRRPTIFELCKILTLAFQSINQNLLSIKIDDLQPEFKSATNFKISSENLVDELNDNTIVIAVEMLTELLKLTRTKQELDLDNLCQLLVEGIHRSNKNLLTGCQPQDVVSIKAKVSQQTKIKSKIGDVIAIPARNKKFFIAVILAKNSFGTALGIFKIPQSLDITSDDLKKLSTLPRPFYTADSLIENGRWSIISQDKSLCRLFPAEPEIYHRPKPYYAGRRKIGPFGAAETATGKFRNLSKDEAEEIGLLKNTFEQIFYPPILEKRLNEESIA